jgi:Ca-activated chloride channel family protein
MAMEKRLVILLMLPFLLFWHWFEPAAKKNHEGIQAYRAQKYDEALQHFLSARGVKPDMAELKNNTASALYQMKKYQEALKEFSTIDPKKVKIPEGDFYYNLGNSFFRVNDLQKALENYKKALKIKPGDMAAKKNYELTLKKLKDQEDKEKEKKQQKQDQDKKDQKDKEKQKQPPPEQQQQKEKKYENIMQYLNQNEKKQMENKKRKIAIVRKEKDW